MQSNALQKIDGILYVAFRTLLELGISEGTIKSAVFRGSQNWVSINNPFDRRETLFAFEPLREKYKELVHSHFGDPYEWLKREKVRKKYESYKSEVVLDAEQAEALDLYTIDGAKLPIGRKNELKQAAHFLQWLESLEPISKRSIREKFGMDKVTEFRKLMQRFVKISGLKLPASNKLWDKLEVYKTAGVECLISGNWGNHNSSKIAGNELAVNVLKGLDSDGRNLSDKEIYRHFIAWAKEEAPALANVTYQSVRSHLEKMDAQTALNKRGKKSFHNRYELKIRRRKLSGSNLQWEIDGTVAPLWYTDEQGKPKRLYVIVIMDTFSKMFIGYSIGYTETTQLSVEAMRNALKKQMFTPYELVMDRGSSLLSGEFKEFCKQWNILQRPAQAGRARAKSIESALGVWMKRVLKLEKNFSGHNITATSDTSKANPEYVKANLKTGTFTKEFVLNQIRESIARYNELCMDSKEQSRKEIQQRHITEHARPITQDTFIENMMLWRKKGKRFTEYRWKSEGIVMAVQGAEFRYHPVVEAETEEDRAVAFADWISANSSQTFYIKYDPTDLEQVALYVCASGREPHAKYMRFFGWAELAMETAPSAIWATKEEKERFKFLRMVQKAQHRATSNDNIIQADFGNVYKDEFNAAKEEALREELLVDTDIKKDQRKELEKTQTLTLNIFKNKNR